ncbi:MAG: hypothetical protein ABI310_07290 [Microbacteriaceae bacterium]
MTSTPGVVAVMRVLGARHLLQGAATLRTQSDFIRRLGGAVDVVHALSMVGLGVAMESHRRAALADAAVAATFAGTEFLVTAR